MAKPLTSAGLDILTQEYRAALRVLLSQHLPTEVYLRQVEELKTDYEQRRTLEMKAIREQWQEDSRTP